MSALSNPQKAELVILAARAFHRTGALARGSGITVQSLDGADTLQDRLTLLALDGSQDSFTTWRHEQVAFCCGKHGLRCCSQNDYGIVKGHFLMLLGEDGRAVKAIVRQIENPRRQIEWKITKLCQDHGLHLAYADKICRAQNRGRGLDDVETKTLWKIFYTLQHRVKKHTPA